MVHQKENIQSERLQSETGASSLSTASKMGKIQWRQELLAGVVSFFAIVYIVIANSSILADAGIPREAGIIAIALASAVGCLLMGLWGKSPIILVPGIGSSAMFTYTLVHGMGLTWQQALGVVVLSGVVFTVISFTSFAKHLQAAIPQSLQVAISVGVGLMLVLIGLKKGGIIVSDPSTIIALQSFTHPSVLVTLTTLMLLCILFMHNVSGSLLITIVTGTVLSYLSGVVPGTGTSVNEAFSWSAYSHVFSQLTLNGVPTAILITATFSLTLVTVFENVGLINAHLQMCNLPKRFSRCMQANALSVIICGLLGTSSSVSTVETAAGISAGGRTGLTAITTGVLFLATLVALPMLTFVPDQAVAPILIFIGGLIMPSVKKIEFDLLHKGLPAFFVIAFIPLMRSIVDGIAIGFISYALFHLVIGKGREVKPLFYVIAVLFLLHFVLPLI